MERMYKLLFSTLSLCFFFDFASLVVGHDHPVESLAVDDTTNTGGLQTYIVHVHGNTSISTFQERERWHKSFLPLDIDSLNEPRFLYSYGNVASGFAARLTEKELKDLKKRADVAHVFPDRMVPLTTTRTPQFLGLQRDSGLWRDSGFGKGVIVGMLDTGITPNHRSFSPGRMPPPPAKWKGACELNEPTECNNKLIGARNFVRGSEAMRGVTMQSSSAGQGPYDEVGHGTHTAGTATGVFVRNANVNNQAVGVAAGMAPSAHLAVYKVCDEHGCATSDILAAMDSAVADGVDVLSLSLSGQSLPFHDDAIAIGAFGAVERGIFVSCSAGNNGPSYSTLTNEAPWILTVGASTTDRIIRATVKLGSQASFDGQSVYQPSVVLGTSWRLVYPDGNDNSSHCVSGSLSNVNVRGKMVLCDDGNVDWLVKGEVVKAAGGAAMIIANFQNEGDTTFAIQHVLPASHVSYSAGLAIKEYIKSTRAPKAIIAFKGTTIRTSPAPVVAFFSSRGPSKADPYILKPDIIGPGMNILAAWPSDDNRGEFKLDSGTSMSAPHLSGIAALLKRSHPDWSPAAIKSAIMTTADITANDGSAIRDQDLDQADFFAVGAGHVNPTRANNPGLIYDIAPESYIAHLCGLSYTDQQVSAIVRRRIKCSNIRSNSDLNYPSFIAFLSANNNYKVTVTRTVTNVGAPNSVYTAEATATPGASIVVKPKRLMFTKAKKEAKFSVTFTIDDKTNQYHVGYLTWISSDKRATVRSPIMLTVV